MPALAKLFSYTNYDPLVKFAKLSSVKQTLVPPNLQYTVQGKILVGKKLVNLANHEPFAKIFLANIHRYTENKYGICTDCCFFAKFFLANRTRFAPAKYFSCTVLSETNSSQSLVHINHCVCVLFCCRKSIERGWQLFTIALAFFPPSIKFRSYLEGYLWRHVEPSSDSHKVCSLPIGDYIS